jgi:hypothetical protein
VVPPRSDRISRVPPYSRIRWSLRIRGYHPLRPAFPDRSACPQRTTGLLRFRSPLLAESRLMSVPPGTEMFQFPGFASGTYGFSARYPKGVGCPIRTSTDQRLLAAPRGFSQRATSFIASWCQGIHRMPFSYAIPLTRIEGSRSTMHRNHPQTRASPRPMRLLRYHRFAHHRIASHRASLRALARPGIHRSGQSVTHTPLNPRRRSLGLPSRRGGITRSDIRSHDGPVPVAGFQSPGAGQTSDPR